MPGTLIMTTQNVTLTNNTYNVVYGTSDANTIDAALVTIPVYLYGLDGDDTLIMGTAGGAAYGGEGDDGLAGGNGPDVLIGGAGKDRLEGGGGNDSLIFDSKDTLLTGGAGIDTAYADAAQAEGVGFTFAAGCSIEVVVGRDGKDVFDATHVTDRIDMYGNGGSDFLFLGTGGGQAFGGDSLDVLISGNDQASDVAHLVGDAGDDLLIGAAGLNRMWGGSGSDIFTGHSGTNVFFIDHEDLAINMLGGTGEDTIVTLAGETVNLSFAETNQVEIAYGNAGADTLNASLVVTSRMDLYGMGGGDTLRLGSTGSLADGGEGDDFLYSGAGNDILVGRAGADHLFAGGGIDSLFGGVGADTFHFGTAAASTYSYIYDFKHTDTDIIDVSGTAAGSFAALTITADAVWSHVVGNGLEIYVKTEGVALVESDFKFLI
jgi:Ca2+-binding RTX toxin-like protein